MNGKELRDRLYNLARENEKFPWVALEGVVQAILGVYMVRGLEYDAEQAIKSMEGFNRSGVLVF